MKGVGKLLGVGLLTLLMLGVSLPAAAQEAAQPPAGPLVHGRLEAKAERSFTLSTKRGQVTVSVATDTRYRVPGVEGATFANLHIGDTILVLGRRAEAGEFLAGLVIVLPPVPVGAIDGQATAIEGQTLTVNTRSGERALLTDEHTQFHVPDVEQPTLADIQVGDRVFALVHAQEGGVLLAKAVVVLPENTPAPIHFRGRVIQVGESWLEVKTRRCAVRVTTTESTRIRVPDVQDPSLSDIRVGDTVLVIGRPAGLCHIEAKAISVLPAVSPHKYAIPGEVLSIEGTTLTVQDPKDTHIVYTDEQTRFRVPGVEDPTLADLQVGDHILAIGEPAEGRNLLARLIIVRPPPQEAAPESEAEATIMTPPPQ
jgi:hypothetical protein